jgi:hypothetical protein
MAVQQEKAASENGANPDEVVPPSIKEVIEKVKSLSTSVDVLEKTDEMSTASATTA